MHRLVVVVLLAACSGAAAPAAPSPPPSDPPPSPAPPTPAPAFELAQLGQPCSASAACVAPAACVDYYGIAGPRGPKFTSCEVACADPATGCPAGTRCVTVADGPGAVCRPAPAP